MATITADQVKRLREKTGAGMMECKAALQESGGDLDRAVERLRKKGLATAAKRAGRSTTEGLVGIRVADDRLSATIVEVVCETDFVARTTEFRNLVDEVTRLVAEAPAGTSHEALSGLEGAVGRRLTAAIATTGENMAVPRSARVRGDYVGSYLHLGGKIGVVVALSGVDAATAASDAFRSFVQEIAMQVAAASPLYVSRDQVPAELLDKERGIYRAQVEQSGKPANVVDKIVEGKLGSYFEQIVLLDQPSIRDPKVKVSQLVAEAGKAAGRPVAVAEFVRFRIGESAQA